MIEHVDDALVCAVVLNHNGREHLEYALPSLAQTEYANFKVIIVDNGSHDDSLEYTQRTHPDMILVKSDINLGWSAGNNLGIYHARQLGAQFVILANNDIRVDGRWVGAAVEVAQQDPRIGIIGFDIIEARGIQNLSRFEQAVIAWSALQTSNPPFVDGMAMFVRMGVFDQIGLIDEGFFAYAEDNDFGQRARKAGYRIVKTNIPVWHLGEGTSGRRPLRSAALQIRNNLRLSLKHDSARGFAYQLARHFAKGCLPFLKVDRTDPVARRLRPSNIIVNFGLLVYALFWNVWHLPATIRQRRQDMRKIRAARIHLGLT